jgi:hypothetical protein
MMTTLDNDHQRCVAETDHTATTRQRTEESDLLRCCHRQVRVEDFFTSTKDWVGAIRESAQVAASWLASPKSIGRCSAEMPGQCHRRRLEVEFGVIARSLRGGTNRNFADHRGSNTSSCMENRRNRLSQSFQRREVLS